MISTLHFASAYVMVFIYNKDKNGNISTLDSVLIVHCYIDGCVLSLT